MRVWLYINGVGILILDSLKTKSYYKRFLVKKRVFEKVFLDENASFIHAFG